MHHSARWPKRPPPITPQQHAHQQAFLRMWHEHLPRRYGLVERFNHASRAVVESRFDGCRTLEVGAGLGEHLRYEDTASQSYTALEIRQDFIDVISGRFPRVRAIRGDIEKGVDIPDGAFDRVLAIHVLEHLRDLPSALREIRRLLAPAGKFVAVIPCEGGLAYGLARRVSAQRLFEKTFKAPYGPIISNEHVSTAAELLEEIPKWFAVRRRTFWPLGVPLIHGNLVIALTCTPHARPLDDRR